MIVGKIFIKIMRNSEIMQLSEKNGKIAVGMSVYHKDKPEKLKVAIDSVLNQTYKNLSLFITVDGPVSDQINRILSMYKKDERVVLLVFPQNEGLATRMNNILDIVFETKMYDYFARMDADDRSVDSRFNLQINYFNNNPEISVLGSDVIEVDENGNNKFTKIMKSQHCSLYRDIIKKCPFNHPTVIFRLSDFKPNILKYNPRLKNTQDYYLWISLAKNGFKFGNINIPLLYFTVNSDFHNRRGIKKALNDFNARIFAMNELKIWSLTNVIHTFALFLLRVSPVSLKKFIYKRFR